MRTAGRVVLAFAAIVMLAACNPLLADPQTTGDLDRSAARYTNGPDDVWVEVAVSGAASYRVYAFTAVRPHNIVGPTTRDCLQNDVVVNCASDLTGVHVPDQVLLATDAPRYAPLMTVWSNETIDVVLVCVDDASDTGCPPTLRLALRTRDGDGLLAGDLAPAPLG